MAPPVAVVAVAVAVAGKHVSPMEKQPNSDMCFVCGRNNPAGLYMQFFDNGLDEVISNYTVPERYQSYPGIVHGGILASMLDEVVQRARVNRQRPGFSRDRLGFGWILR